MADVEIVYAHHHKDKKPADRAAVEEGLARRLVRAGIANYATKSDAIEAEGPAGEERTVSAARKRAREAQ
jgi:non-canonical (house-cleaning) NTP pyrophosphatase